MLFLVRLKYGFLMPNLSDLRLHSDSELYSSIRTDGPLCSFCDDHQNPVLRAGFGENSAVTLPKTIPMSAPADGGAVVEGPGSCALGALSRV